VIFSANAPVVTTSATRIRRNRFIVSFYGGLIAFQSPDAIHWSLIQDEPVITEGAFDSQNIAFFDAVRGQYRAYQRAFRKGRDVKTETSPAFFDNWTPAEWLEYVPSRGGELYTMNLSGEAVQAATRFFKFSADAVAVAHDDVELPFGEVGVRFGGGLAGHNGLRSIAHCMATQNFWRVRIGIGRPVHGELHGHVLGRFTQDEEAELTDILRGTALLVQTGYRDGFSSLPARTRARSVGQN